VRAPLAFPNPVDEKAARTVAAAVLALSVLTLITGARPVPGCRVFATLMTLGLVPEEICADCADISARLARAGS
jgi:hypothetical protein